MHGGSCLNDSCPIGLTSTIIKCFERLVTAHVSSALSSTHDPHKSTGLPHSPFPSGPERLLRASALHPLQFCLQWLHFPHTYEEAPRPASQRFSGWLNPGGFDQRPTGTSTAPKDAPLPRTHWRSTHRSNATVKFANGTAIIINNEMGYRHNITTLTSWFRTTRSSSGNSVFTPHATTHTLASHNTSLHRWTHSACLSVSASFVFFLFVNMLVYFNIFFLILHLLISCILSCIWSFTLLNYILCTFLSLSP